MAATKTKRDKNLYESLRDSGVRKKVAKRVSEAIPNGGSTNVKPTRKAAERLSSAADEIKDRVSGGPKKRSEAAKKAAKTRKANAAKRSKSAKKAAKTKAKSKR